MWRTGDLINAMPLLWSLLIASEAARRRSECGVPNTCLPTFLHELSRINHTNGNGQRVRVIFVDSEVNLLLIL